MGAARPAYNRMTASNTAIKLTREQQAALEEHTRSVSLAAGAGCGKTFVLTQRFLSYLDPQQIEPSAELHELVAITFTDSAAREMRERIRRRCYERFVQATDAGEKQAWNRLIRSLDGARVSTIHSFCATLLRNHPAEAEVDPRFELLDSPAAELLRLQTVDDRLRQLLLAGDEQVLQLATRFGLNKLRDDVIRLLGKGPNATITKWLEASPEKLANTWHAYFSEVIVPGAISAILESEPIVQLRKCCETAQVSKVSLSDHFAEILEILAQLPGNKAPQASLLRLLKLARVQGVCSKKDWDDSKEYDQYKTSAEAVRALLKSSILKDSLADDPVLLETASVGLDLLKLVAEIARHYERVKKGRNVLEFDDLLLLTHRLLTDSRFAAIQKSLNRGTRLLMVDEFQDTDPQQVAIVKAFCGDHWEEQGLFVVGDSKQSIYRFRGAEPRVSNKLRATLPSEGRLSLTTSFRSNPALLDFINALFHSAFREEYEPLQPSRAQLVPAPSVEFLWTVGDQQREDQNDELSQRMGKKHRARVREARAIAQRLAQLLESDEPLVADNAQGTRPLELGDIAILLRSLSDAAIYEEALREQGLDYYLAGGHAFYAQQEIYDLLHLLRAIASPADERSLAGALRSPLFALEDETLFWLVQSHGSLNAGLFSDSLPSSLSEEAHAKVVRAATFLGKLRARKDQLLVAELLSEAIALTGYDAMLLSEFLGPRKMANLQKLVEQARALDRMNPGDLNGFITQLTEFVVRKPKESLAATQSESEVIHIMTIHHAKGLEFPLVIVPDLDRKGRRGGRWPVFDEHLGPLVPAATKEERVGWDLHRFVEQEQDQEERKRLLYVACTRAADYLILSSSIKDLQKPTSDWLKFLGKRFDLQTGRCIADLPADYGEPQVRVACEEPAIERKTRGKLRGANLDKLVEQTRQLAESGMGTVPDSIRPIPVDARARKRFSFSRLSGSMVREDRPASEAIATDSPSLDPRGFGTLLHAVLERIDFARANDILGLCEPLASLHMESNEQQAAEEAARLVGSFLQSSRAAALAEAKEVCREVEFVLPWPPGQKPFEGRYIQGVIDCLYQDTSGDWHLLDYKSNQVDAAGVPKAASHYAMQMAVYATACERALGVRPVESVLHFLRPATEFSFQWTDAERAEIAAQIDRAIASQLS